MARINIDSKFFTDRRIDNLAVLMRSSRAEAESNLLRLWHFCYTSIEDTFDRSLIDLQATFEDFSGMLLKCHLAVENENKTITIKGVDKRIGYLKRASEYGQKSAEVRKAKNGTAQPSKVSRSYVEATFEPSRTSSSSSSTGGGSGSAGLAARRSRAAILLAVRFADSAISPRRRSMDRTPLSACSMRIRQARYCSGSDLASRPGSMFSKDLSLVSIASNRVESPAPGDATTSPRADLKFRAKMSRVPQIERTPARK